MTKELERQWEVCQAAARAGGEALQAWVGRFSAREKGPADLVTEADLASQTRVREVVHGAFPEHGWLGEEQDGHESSEGPYRWIVDPLDGTSNYVHGFRSYAVSIGLEHQGELIAGAIFDPAAGEMFTAARGRGAFLNGARLQVSGQQRLSQAMVAASFPARVLPGDRLIDEFVAALLTAQATRRIGSAALSLAYLAAGRFDAYWARDNKPWDVAAGLLIVEEAGGHVRGLDSPRVDIDDPKVLACASVRLAEEMLELLRGVRHS